MDITPGQDYTFILTPEDPGLAEEGINGTFFDGFESGSLATNNWTTSGAGDPWSVRVPDVEGVYQGTYSLSVEATGSLESIVETDISTVGYSNIEFSFYASTGGLDPGEYIAADWYDGTGWTNVLPQRPNINSYTLFNYSLPAIAD